MYERREGGGGGRVNGHEAQSYFHKLCPHSWEEGRVNGHVLYVARSCFHKLCPPSSSGTCITAPGTGPRIRSALSRNLRYL